MCVFIGINKSILYYVQNNYTQDLKDKSFPNETHQNSNNNSSANKA